MMLHQLADRTLQRAKGRGVALGTYLYFDMESTDTLPWRLEFNAARWPERTALLYEGRRWTFAEANRIVNRHAHAYKALGLRKGDVAALMMENRPEYLWHFYALGKIGVTASLINTHLADDPLAHAICVCEPKKILIGSEVWDLFQSVRSQMGSDCSDKVLVDIDSENPAAVDLPLWQERLEGASSANPPETRAHRLKDLMAYIYTSGTTGLPKPALVKHHRLYRAGRIFGGLAWNLTPYETIYNCLPLYHGNGMMLAATSAMQWATPMALARKFSATRFWDDIRRYDATCFIYIGELCRYLLNQPPSPGDRNHRVRAIAGNGLRPDVWERFQDRFGIDKVVEFYAATEGNAETMNITGRVGACGILIPTRMALARWDEDAGDFIRDRKGRLIKCKAGEPGVLMGKIKPKNEFVGYKNPEATESKILRNVFSKGDAWFNTGDLLRKDRLGFLYFMDRLGDTYRWKGENVSTFEVQEQISEFPDIEEVNVYGVHIHGTEGRAGMAAVVLREGRSFTAEGFFGHVDANLPTYARPIFVRIRPALETTGTFKLKKRELMKEGFDPSVVKDPLWFLHPLSGKYIRLTPELHGDIVSGKLRL